MVSDLAKIRIFLGFFAVPVASVRLGFRVEIERIPSSSGYNFKIYLEIR